jgi:protein TonB
VPASRPTPDTGGDSSGPRVIFQPLPEIPDELRRHVLHLNAVVRFAIAADGSATAVLERATPDPRLNTALLAAFARWRFFPAVEHGKPVPSTLTLNVPVIVR